MSESLEGKVVLVTGAARRIGRAVALELGRLGAQVAVHYRNSREDAERTASDVGGQAFQADLADVSQIRRLFEQLDQAYDGRLDCLVNNAAVFERMPLLETTEEQWDRLQAANLKACFFTSQQAAARMRERGSGRIVNVSSLGGIRPWAGYAPYNASKAGLIHMTRSLAKELAPKIQVNAVAPGVIEFSDDHTAEVRRQIDSIPMRRAGSGADVAEAVAYFLTCSTYVTGQLLAVDGGLMSFTGRAGPSE